MVLSKRIKQLRIDKGITQEKLAEYLNVSFQAVSKWENGSSSPDIQLLPKISAYFGVTIDDLFTLNVNSHLERIENMIEQHNDISLQDETYAKNYLLGLVEHETLSAKAYQLLASLSAHRSRSYQRQTINYAKEALKREPNDKYTHSLLIEGSKGACSDWNYNNHYELIKYYKKFTTNHPELKRGHLFLIDQLIDAGRLEEAKDTLEQIKRIEDNYLVTLYQGILYQAEGDTKKGFDLFDQMILDEPDNWLTWATRGDMLARHGYYEEAIEDNLRAHALQPSPKYVDAPECNAMIYEILGQKDKAISMYELALKILREDWQMTFGVLVDEFKGHILRLSQ